MQLTALVVGVVHARDAGAELEAQQLVVTEQLGHRHEVVTPDEERDLAAVHDDLLDRRGHAGAGQAGLQRVGDLVEPAAEGA